MYALGTKIGMCVLVSWSVVVLLIVVMFCWMDLSACGISPFIFNNG